MHQDSSYTISLSAAVLLTGVVSSSYPVPGLLITAVTYIGMEMVIVKGSVVCIVCLPSWTIYRRCFNYTILHLPASQVRQNETRS